MANLKDVTLKFDIVDKAGSKVDASGKPYGESVLHGKVDTDTGKPVGGSRFVEAYNNQQSGVKTYVYKDPENPEAEGWEPASAAKATIGITRTGNKAQITLFGPDWLTNEVKNSDWFKNNYDNKTFRKFVEAYVNNPNGSYTDPNDDTKTITYSETWKNLTDAFNEQVSAYKEVAAFKDRVAANYGVELNDSQASIAATTYSKDDYDKNGAVYIPEWMSKKFDFSKYESWNPDTRTISAGDFFEKYYTTANWDANGVRDMKDFLRREVNKQALYAHSNIDRENKPMLDTDDYREEVARTIAMTTIMQKNDSESDFGMDMAMFGAGLLGGFLDGLNNTFTGIGQTVTEILKAPSALAHGLTHDVLGMDEESADVVSFVATLPTSLGYTALSAVGEVYNAIGEGKFEEFTEGISKDLDMLSDFGGGNAWGEVRDRWKEGMDIVTTEWSDMSKASESGKVFGEIVYKIVENIVLLNKAGSAAGEVVTKVGAKGQITAKLMGAKNVLTAGSVSKIGLGNALAVLSVAGEASKVAGFVKAGAFVANIAVQGAIETLADDSDAFMSLLDTGDTEVFGVLMRNTGYNAFGEALGSAAEGIKGTAVGKAVSFSARKATNKLASYRYSGIHKLMEKVYGANPANEAIANKMAFVGEQARLTKEIGAMKIADAAKVGTEVNAEAVENVAEGAERSALGLLKNAAKEKAAEIEAAYEKQQAKILERVALENAYDSMNASIKQAMKNTESELDQKAVKEYYENAKAAFEADQAALKSGLLTKSEIPGNKLSQEASDYLSYKQQVNALENRKAVVAENKINTPRSGSARSFVTFTGKDEENLGLMQEKLEQLSSKLNGASKGYTDILDNNYEALANYRYSLSRYELDNQLFTDPAKRKEKVYNMSNGVHGKDGSEYFRTERYYEGENYADNIIRDTKAPRSASANKARAKMDVDAHFIDPNTVMMLELSRISSLKLQGDWQRALIKSTGANKNIALTKTEKNIASNFRKMRKENLKAFKIDNGAKSKLGKAIQEEIRKNDIFSKAYQRSVANAKVKKTAKAIGEGTESLSKEMKLDDPKVVNQTIGKMSSSEIESINLGLTKNKIPEYDLKGMKAAEFGEWYEGLPDTSKNFISSKLAKQGKKVNLTNTRSFLRDNDNARTILQRNYISNNKAIQDTAAFKRVITTKRANTLLARRTKLLKKYTEELGEYGDALASATQKAAGNIIDTMTKEVAMNKSSMMIVEGLVKEGVSEETAIRYVTLHNLKNVTKGDLKKALKASELAKQELVEAAPGIKATSLDHYIENQANALYSEIQSEYNDILKTVSEAGEGAIDPNEVYDRVVGYVKDIQAKAAADNVVAYPDVENGMIRYIEVDPVTADLYNLRPGAFTMTLDDYGAGSQHVIKFFNRMNRIFQWGTTGFSLTSFANQWFRDSFNAVVVGGARPFLDFGIGREAANEILGKSFGGKIAKSFIDRNGARIEQSLRETLSKEEWDIFEATAKESGMSLEEMSTRYVVSETGFGRLPGQEQLTTVGYYQGGDVSGKFMGDTNKVREELFDNVTTRKQSLYAKDGVSQSTSKIDNVSRWISEKQLGSWRETTLRENVYVSSYSRALEAGMTESEAKIWATRFALDATTDFARPLMIGDAISKSVPYFGAAINGVESFYRLMEIDPMGIAGRFMGGLVLPMMEAVGRTLSSEEDKAIYANIPEYEKEDAIVFVQNGETISIPIPQEISAFLAPFRQAVEKANDANDHSWRSLIAADILSISPVDLSGFVDLDANELLGDPSFLDRIARGTEKAISGLLPSAAKAAYKALSGRDPFTGKSIDRSYTYVDDYGNIQVMDSTQSEFAKWFSDTMGGELTASSAYSIFKDLLGRAGMDLADAVVTTLTKGVADGAVQLATRTGEGALGVVNPDTYNQGRNEWYNAVRQLEQEKRAMQGDKEFQSIAQQISFETDPGKLKMLYANYDEYTYQFQKKVCNMVETLKKKYPGMYNRTRQSAVISLLNMNTEFTGTKSAYARSLSKEIYYQGRQNAIATMQEMGFTSTEDNSILGYSVVEDGEVKFKYNNPLAILNLGNTVYGQSNINKANIEAILDTNEITRGKMFGDEYNALQTKEQKKAYKAEWNKKVVMALAPYIQQHGVSAVLEDFETRDLLDNYIFIDNPYKTKDYLYKIFGGE